MRKISTSQKMTLRDYERFGPAEETELTARGLRRAQALTRWGYLTLVDGSYAITEAGILAHRGYYD